MFVYPKRRVGRTSLPGQGLDPRIEVFSSLVESREELKQADEECFSWATAKLALGESSVEEYFDRLIDHIRQGGARHSWDKSNSNIDDALQVDMIAGAFKSRMLKRGVGRISHAVGDQLKALCVLFYREAELAEVLRRIELDIGVTLASLPAWIIDILGIIAYARQHADILEHLVKNYRASSKTAKSSTFDLLGASTVAGRRGPDSLFHHSTGTSHNCELEWRIWTTLLKAEPKTWLHYPLRQETTCEGIPVGLCQGLRYLADYWRTDHQLRASPLFLEYLRALKLRGVILDTLTISRFLSVTEGSNINFTMGGPFLPVSAALARTMLELFPLGQSLRADYRGGGSAEVAMPITQWPADNPDRLVVMEMLLKQGLVVDGKISDYPRNYNPEPMGPTEYQDQKSDTCLILAADRGDAEMVTLLLKYGAKRSVKDARGRTAAKRARKNGHTELADSLQSPSPTI